MEGAGGADALVGSALADDLSGGDGGDVVRPGGGAARIALGAGADQLVGALADLDGDVVADFETEDSLLIVGAAFGVEALTVTPGSAVLSLDEDGDGAAEAVITLEGAFEGAVFTVEQESAGVRIALGAGAPPQPLDDAARVIEDRRATGDVLANDGEPDGDPLTVTAVNGEAAGVGAAVQGRWGTLVLGADGGFAYQADRADALIAGQSRKDAFEYVASDGGLTAAATLTVTVLGADEALIGKGARDVLRGGGGDDTLLGRGGADVLRGGGGDDVANGQGGDDQVLGERGDDLLRGGGGGDRLFGGGGRDALHGQRGADRLKGGGGGDDFHFKRGDGRDVILDWDDRRDEIHIDRGAKAFGQLEIYQKGRHAFVEYGKRGDVIKLLKTDADDLDRGDFAF